LLHCTMPQEHVRVHELSACRTSRRARTTRGISSERRTFVIPDCFK
jgi:hypothetical protein